MKTMLCLSTLVLAASVAHAQPALTASTDVAPRGPDAYLSFGGMAGGNDTKLTGAFTAELGRRIGDSALWVHGQLSLGSAAELFGSGSGNFVQMRAGIEARNCTPGGHACIVTGVDAGIQHVEWTGVETGFFDDGGDTMTTTYDSTRAIVVPRLGLDLGGAVRFRPGIELALGSDGVDGANLTGALAFQW